MLSFPIIFINTCSILMICMVIIFSWKRRENTCAVQVIIISLFMLIWSMGSLLELSGTGVDQKILWRNIEQIGVFGTPVATLIFSIIYTGYFKEIRKKISTVLYFFQAVAVFLIFTDKWHHLIRSKTYIVVENLSDTLVVQTTSLARILISINFIYMLAAAILLLTFLFSPVAGIMKKQSFCVLIGMTISIVYALLKIVSNEMFIVSIPISGVFALSDLFMLLGILQFDLIKLAPLARNEVFNIIDDGIIITTVAGKIVDFNRAAEKIFEYAETNTKESIAKKIENQMDNLLPVWKDLLNSNKKMDFSLNHENIQQHYVVEQYPVHGKKDIIGSFSVIKNVTEQKLYSDFLKFKAEKDGLTSTYNRKTFIEKCELMICEKEIGYPCLLYMDIDYFKKINDQYGHIAGDYVLTEFSTLIQSVLAQESFMGRMGGEEFAVFQWLYDNEKAVNVGEYLRKIVEEHKFIYNDMLIKVTISVGIAAGHVETFDNLYSIADKNLYKAKEAGRNRVF